MSISNTKQLHWTQRIALVRHNLHAAIRSGDFGFFKTLQAAGLIEGTNHVATLTAILGEEADPLIAGLDNLNTGLGYIHQDAFRAVYDNIKTKARDQADGQAAGKSNLYVDITMQKNTVDMSIDKIANSAIILVNMQRADVQDTAANVWITGITLVADCIEVSLREMDKLDTTMDDFIRLEESWNTVKGSVIASVTSLKGVFSLMDPTFPQEECPKQARSLSISSASSAVFRRLSTAFSPPQSPTSRSSSIASNGNNGSGAARAGAGSSLVNFQVPMYSTPNYVRNSVSGGCPTKLPRRLEPIPPTPTAEGMDPFNTEDVPPMPVPVLEPTRLTQMVV